MPLNFPVKVLNQPVTISINKMASSISHSMKSIIKNKKLLSSMFMSAPAQ